MEQEFRLGDALVVPSKNQIIRGDVQVTMPPKTIAVLNFLAKEQGKVVTADVLMENIWRNSIVSPSTLQQCIAKLRKALGDDGKQQFIIKTHAKKGYSLELAVSWNDINESSNQQSIKPVQQSVLKPQHYFLFSFLLITVIFLVYQKYMSDNPEQIYFDTLTPLTATDEKEAAAQYSPEGDFIIFQRAAGFCGNTLWAKDLKQHKEYPLIKGVGACSGGSFSPDAKQLVFMSKSQIDLTEQPRNCFNLMKIDLIQALKSPQDPEIILNCDRGTFDEPLWLNDGTIVLFQQKNNSTKLLRYSLVSDELSDFYFPEDIEIYSSAYSPELDLIAVTGINKKSDHILSILDSKGTVLSTHTIKHPNKLALLMFVFPSFDAKREQLIFSSGKALFYLSFTGEVTKIQANVNNEIYLPRMSPDGKSIIATQGIFDSDIAEISFNQQEAIQKPPVFNQVYTPYVSIERSIFIERNAKYNPSGNIIAFVSNRSGEQQLWLKGIDTLKQLSNFKRDSIIMGYSWAPDGSSIIVTANASLYRITLDGIIQQINIEHPIIGVYGWTEDNVLLLKTRIGGDSKLLQYNLNLKKIIKTTSEKVNWASISPQGHIVYLDSNNQFWQLASTALLPRLVGGLQGKSNNGSFVMNDEIIYSINREGYIWSYDLKTELYQVIRKIDESVMKISDVRDKILLTQAISAKKDVVKLSSSHFKVN